MKMAVGILVLMAAFFAANARRYNGVNVTAYDRNMDRCVWSVCAIVVLSGLSMVIEGIAEAIA